MQEALKSERDLYRSPYKVFKSRKFTWAGHVARLERGWSAIKILTGKHKENVKSSRPSLRETRDKRSLGRDPDRNWCYDHTSVKLLWSQSMGQWTSSAAYGQGEKFSA